MLPDLVDGIYSLHYRTVRDGGDCAKGLAIVRQNEIIGSDESGGVFRGTLTAYPPHATIFRGSMSIPPDGELITGLRVGPEGIDLEICAIPDTTGDGLRFEVDIGGMTIGVEATYVGPLPSGLTPHRRSSRA